MKPCFFSFVCSHPIVEPKPLASLLLPLFPERERERFGRVASEDEIKNYWWVI